MKKILSILAVMGLTSTAVMGVVACTETPTKSAQNVHVLARVFNQAVSKAIEDNPLTPLESGVFDTEAIKADVIKNMNDKKSELEAVGIHLIPGYYQENEFYQKAFKSVAEFNKLTQKEKDDHQKYLTENNFKHEDIIIFVDSTFITASLDNPERITINIPRLNIVDSEGYDVLFNNGFNLTQMGIVSVKK
ncbi:lipoprotein [Spiroplasma alleghenense]|uniref:Lipoprotein n=1 Tax=Spiroplasma alleghenense TaxID=216931 RepID=A0A345Z535_9MOLU|nr:lipoprotein [Spiroplasma alleghenense]AXK51714.1 hypothetical protein SALLE_v1c10440 [Spiroplasma alleghenense]